MNQPSMTSPEYLQSDEGKAFARKFLADLLLQPEAPRAGERALTEFETLLHEYIEHLAQDMREYRDLTPEEENALKAALTELYEERFNGFYPSRGIDVYLMDLTRLARWLAAFTCEAWLMATEHRQSPFKPQKPGEEVRLMHLHWAREAFGWWLSALSKLPYNIKIQRLPKRGMAGQLAAIVADDPQLAAAVARLARGGVEVDNGCPLC
jgi:hypothetical protein